jgi:hypothetical protein
MKLSMRASLSDDQILPNSPVGEHRASCPCGVPVFHNAAVWLFPTGLPLRLSAYLAALVVLLGSHPFLPTEKFLNFLSAAHSNV